jgi:hypothetical protein
MKDLLEGAELKEKSFASWTQDQTLSKELNCLILSVDLSTFWCLSGRYEKDEFTYIYIFGFAFGLAYVT